MSKVTLSSRDRVLFPDDGITKGDLFDYYDAVAPAIVPHLRDRPFTMKRWSEGLPGRELLPEAGAEGDARRGSRPASSGRGRGAARASPGSSTFPLVNSRDALLWMVQMHCIDMNCWYSRVDKPDRPDFVLFDLDPPEEPDGFALAVRVAHLIREALEASTWTPT